MNLTLQRYATVVTDAQVWPLRVVAVGTDVSSNIFVMRTSPAGLDSSPMFVGVASLSQMLETAEDAPAPGQTLYRVSDITLVCRSADAAQEAWTTLLDATQDLLNSIALSTSLNLQETVTLTPDVN